MDPIAAFAAYAADFERCVADDEWSRLERHFAEDAVYRVTGQPPLGGTWSGRDGVLEHLREVLDDFDRRFDSRRVEPLGDFRVEGAALELDWRGIYTLEGAPDLEIRGTERVELDADGRIRLLEDRMAPETDDVVLPYVARYLT